MSLGLSDVVGRIGGCCEHGCEKCVDLLHNNSVAIVGENGCGKSRFMARLVAKRPAVIAAPARRGIDDNGTAHRSVRNVQFDEMVSELVENDLNMFRQQRPSILNHIEPLWKLAFGHIKLVIVPDPAHPDKHVLLAKRRLLDCKNDAHAKTYAVQEMSDGEKGVLLLLFLLFKEHDQSRVVVVDEPEAHLHPALVDTFWRAVERNFRLTFFVYLTHDLMFAGTRFHPFRVCLQLAQSCDGCTSTLSSSNERPVLLKDKTCNATFRLSRLPDGEYDADLADRVLGVHRRNVLFIEGNESTSADAQLYTYLLPDWTVVPSGSCSMVKPLAKAFRSTTLSLVTNTPTQRVYGLIDADYRESATDVNVFRSPLAIVENLYVVPEALRKLWADEARVQEFMRKCLSHITNDHIIGQKEQATRVDSAIDVNLFAAVRIADEATDAEVNDKYCKFLRYWKTKPPKTRLSEPGSAAFDFADVFGKSEWPAHKAQLVCAVMRAHGAELDSWRDAFKAWIPDVLLNVDQATRQPATGEQYWDDKRASERQQKENDELKRELELLRQALDVKDEKIKTLEAAQCQNDDDDDDSVKDLF